MTPHYSDPVAAELWREAALSWRGVRFRDNSADRRLGISCDRLQYVLHSAGRAVDGVDELPCVDMAGGWHGQDDVMLDFLESLPGLHQLDLDAGLMVGDVLTMRLGRLNYHCAGVYDAERIIHADYQHGVVMERLDSIRGRKRLSDRITTIWRFSAHV